MRTAITTVLLTLAAASKLGKTAVASPAGADAAPATAPASADATPAAVPVAADNADYTNFSNIDTQVTTTDAELEALEAASEGFEDDVIKAQMNVDLATLAHQNAVDDHNEAVCHHALELIMSTMYTCTNALAAGV